MDTKAEHIVEVRVPVDFELPVHWKLLIHTAVQHLGGRLRGAYPDRRSLQVVSIFPKRSYETETEQDQLKDFFWRVLTQPSGGPIERPTVPTVPKPDEKPSANQLQRFRTAVRRQLDQLARLLRQGSSTAHNSAAIRGWFAGTQSVLNDHGWTGTATKFGGILPKRSNEPHSVARETSIGLDNEAEQARVLLTTVLGRIDDRLDGLSDADATSARPLPVGAAPPAAEPDWPQQVVFVSHAHADVGLAAALVDLLRASLDIPADRIRCTSVPGYSLDAGDDTEERLRWELWTSQVVIGLITPASIESGWVLFELGCRWGLQLLVAPVVLGGASFSDLPGPLSQKHAVDGGDRVQLLTLLSSLSRKANLVAVSAAQQTRSVDRFLRDCQDAEAQ